MSDEKKLQERGYKPAQQPPTKTPNEGNPGAGYQPSTNQGDNAAKPPKKP